MERMIRNCKLYDLLSSVIASGYPMEEEIKYGTLTKDGLDRAFKRAKTLASRESTEGHDNFLAGIIVSFDLTCSIKMWTEFERYHFAQIVSSQSTMHRLTRMNILEKCVPEVDYYIKQRVNNLQAEWEKTGKEEDRLKLLYSCPTGLTLTARVTTNFRQLKTIYKQRHDHALPEWREFCKELLSIDNFADWCVEKEKDKEIKK